jgi:hypothetical protein
MQHELLKNKSAQCQGQAVYKRSCNWEVARAVEIHFGKKLFNKYQLSPLISYVLLSLP